MWSVGFVRNVGLERPENEDRRPYQIGSLKPNSSLTASFARDAGLDIFWAKSVSKNLPCCKFLLHDRHILGVHGSPILIQRQGLFAAILDFRLTFI